MDWICSKEEWKELNSIIEITAERTNKQTGSYQQKHRYYISDLLQSAESFNENIRSHWGIVDVAFGEDGSRKRAGYTAENFSILNRLALNLLKTDTTVKASIKRKRKMAGWDEGYLEQLLSLLKI